MYKYIWDEETGGLILTTDVAKMSKEPRPVYYRELNLLGFNKFWDYPQDDSAPIMWAESSNYIYRGRNIAKLIGGALMTAPELVVLEKPTKKSKKLVALDIPAMVQKNAEILEPLAQEAIQKTYNTYVQYKDKVDVFYVAFSGGKDSIVTLDVVQKALPHDRFMVHFGDTRMEFPDTYVVVDQIEEWCKEQGIEFIRSMSEFDPGYTWNHIGPPAQKMRWCCSVHKTAPQILHLRRLQNNPHFRGMAMMGVRGDESLARSQYDDLSFGKKHQGQYDFYPILNWSSAELFLYTFQEKLLINEAYKKGNSRAGCLVCPMGTAKNNWFKEQAYAGAKDDSTTTTFYNSIITEKTFAKELPPEQYREFMDIGVWKSRHNGSKLAEPRNIYHEQKEGDDLIVTLDSIHQDWREWFKTLGSTTFLPTDSNGITPIHVFCDGYQYHINYVQSENKHIFTLSNVGNSQKEIYFASWLKIVLKKACYCIGCQVCEANCPNGFILMKNGRIFIDEKCVQCKKCYKVSGGCLVATSHHLPKEERRMTGSIDQYKNMGVRYPWVVDYFKKPETFLDSNNLGSEMLKSLKKFLKDAKVIDKSNKPTDFGQVVFSYGSDSPIAWGLMLCNLVYTPQFNWWVKYIEIDREYSSAEFDVLLNDQELTVNSKKNVVGAFKNIFATNPILSEQLGFGKAEVQEKGRSSTLLGVSRSFWATPDSKVILYCLYKFAEACDVYQISLSNLQDSSIERDGVTPYELFGLDSQTMTSLLNGLSVNYPDYINASFTLDLDTITLYNEKKSSDVLTLF